MESELASADTLLLEYDNDPENPEGNNRSAQESAIFTHFRRNPAARPDIRIRQSDYLGSYAADGTQAGSTLARKRSRGSRGSIDALRNPFNRDSVYEDEQDVDPEEDMEVDLSSWGLDQFIPKEKGSKSKGKQKQSPAPTLAAVRSNTISGGPNDFGELPAAMGQSRPLHSLGVRRASTSSRMELGEDSNRRRANSQATFPASNLDGNVPFPSGRQSPGYDQIGSLGHQPRSQSRMSMGLDEFHDNEDTRPLEQSDNPFALQPPSHTSRFDPKAPVHARTISHGSLSSRQLLDNFDSQSQKSHDSLPRDRPYSVVELLRPKVLVMPSPLQPVGPPPAEEAPRDGFQISKDGPPLPPGARSASRRLSTNLDAVPNPGNSFIPNPTADLSYAQRMFRNTLAGGALDGESALPKATEDGEKVEFDPIPSGEDEDLLYGISGQPKPKRPAGKLYGKSLIDDLEARKQAMRNKQRRAFCTILSLNVYFNTNRP